MGQFSELSVIMQFLIAASLLVAGTNAQLVAYANGAVAPFDPNNAKATAEHQKAIAEAGGVNFPFGVHATGLWCLMCMLPTLWSMAREMLMPSLSTTLTVLSPLMTLTYPPPLLPILSPRATDTDTPTHMESTERERLMPSLFTTLTALLPLMPPTLPLPPTHTLPPGLEDTTDTLTYTERGRLSFPSTWSPDTPMSDTPTSDTAWLP